MNCPNCGSETNGSRFCPRCGTALSEAAPYNAVSNQQNQTLGNPTQVLVFGIIGLALCETGILGLIFSIIGLVKAKNYLAAYGPVSIQVNTGKRLATAGLIVSIIMIVLWVVLIVAIIVAAANAPKSDWDQLANDLDRYLKNY